MIHPSVHVSRFVRMGEGVTILAATVNPGTTMEDNIRVSYFSVGGRHDDYLELSLPIFPNATVTGGVRIKEFVHVGSGAVIAPNLDPGEDMVMWVGVLVVSRMYRKALSLLERRRE